MESWLRFVKRRKKEEEQGLQENKYPGARVVAAFSLAGCGSAGVASAASGSEPALLSSSCCC